MTSSSNARFADRTALVTGSTSGIGEAIAHRLADEGAHVLVSGRDADRGAACVERIRAGGGRADFLAVDLGGPYAGIRAFAADAVAALGGRLDVLVNNAGVYPAPATVDLTDDDLDALLAVNIAAPYVLSAALIPRWPNAARGWS